MKLEYEVKRTKYDEGRSEVVLDLTTSVNLSEKEYEAVQKITGNRFGELYDIEHPEGRANNPQGLKGRIGIRDGRVGKLGLYGLSLKELDGSFRELKGLEELNLSGNELTQLPEWIGELKSLKYLNLNNCCLTSLPESIGELENLASLSINSNDYNEFQNQLTALPQSIGNMRSLGILSVDNNKLTSFPDSIWELPYKGQLSQIDASNNQIVSFPDNVDKDLELLRVLSLNLGGNPLNRKSKRIIRELNDSGRYSIRYKKRK